MYLFFDTETNGIPKSWKATVEDVENWPRVVQIAYLLCDSKGLIEHQESKLIKPQGWIIPPAATAVHGITQEQAVAGGLPIKDVLFEMSEDLLQADVLVAHNIDFDQPVVGAEFWRLGWKNILAGKQTCCTMRGTRDWCDLPKGPFGKPKLPRLSELYNRVFDKDFKDQHSAMADVQATYEIFWKLKAQGFPWDECTGRSYVV